MLINHLFLSAVKVRITIRVELSTIALTSVPLFIRKIILFVGNSISRISDCPLKYNETVNNNIYCPMWDIIYKIMYHYITESIQQIYKILGAIDIIGNPTKFVDTLGDGFAELISEPREGFALGPAEFGKGLAKGVGSFFGHVIEGGFSIVGSASGSLLQSINSIKEPNKYSFVDEEEEPQNVLSGTVEGFKQGFAEIGKGFANLYLLPKKYGDKEGAKGVFKGLGLGLLGLVLMPVTAVLTLVKNIANGIKNTAGMLTNKPLKTVRFRHPRVINEGYPLQVYDTNFAEAKELCFRYNNEISDSIYYSERFMWAEKKYKNKFSTAVLTENNFVVFYGNKKKVFRIKNKYLTSVELHKLAENYVILFFYKKNKNDDNLNKKAIVFRKEFSRECCLLFDVVNELINEQKLVNV